MGEELREDPQNEERRFRREVDDVVQSALPSKASVKIERCDGFQHGSDTISAILSPPPAEHVAAIKRAAEHEGFVVHVSNQVVGMGAGTTEYRSTLVLSKYRRPLVLPTALPFRVTGWTVSLIVGLLLFYYFNRVL